MRAEPSWLLARLDSLLSEPLRNARPSELIRHRILVGAECFLILFSALYLLALLVFPIVSPVQPALLLVGHSVTLSLMHKARSLTVPAMAQLVVLSFGVLAAIFSVGNPDGGIHAATMLLPALAVYLLGSRLGLVITLALSVAVGLVHPLYRMWLGQPAEAPTLGFLWVAHVTAAFALLGAWLLGSLHSTARDAAQKSLEQTMKEFRESERKLRSILESTDDPVLSLDSEGRMLTANPAARRLYAWRTGTQLELGQWLIPPGGTKKSGAWEQHLARALRGERLRLEEEYRVGESHVVLDIRISPILDEGGQPVGVTVFGRDITSRKEAELRLGEMYRTLGEVSRQAGMAEIATGVLHNVGNALNSVNVSASIVSDRIRLSRLTGLAKVAHLLRGHAADFSSFLVQDPQGRKLPSYLIALSDELQEEREAMAQEMRALSASVDHIKSIVSMQQKHARAAGAVEELDVPQLIDEALRLHAVSFERQGIHIEREYAEVPPIVVDRHKLLQILINLLSNARHALMDSPTPDKHLSIRVRSDAESGRVSIDVEDNGVGIAPENLPRLFTQGFTTKKEGHGFGLHISALAAAELKGRLSCTSRGPGLGATFTLALPLEREDSVS